MTRILLLAPSFTGTPGGITRYAESLLDSDTLATRGYHVTAVPTHSKGAAPLKVALAVGAGIRIIWERPRHPITHALVASHASGFRKLALLAESRAIGALTMAHFQSSSAVEWIEALPNRWKRRVIASINRTHLVVTLGSRLADFLRGVGVRVPIRIIPNGVSPVPPRPAHPPGAPRYVLTAGELGSRKGTWDLLNAFATLHARHPDVELVLAGDGAVSEARARAVELGISKVVKLPGWVDVPGLRDLLARAAAFILPSYREGMSFAVLEALMQGTPVIATPVGEQASVITHEVTGLLVPPGDTDAIVSALDSILTKPALAEGLGNEGRRWAQERYSISANHASLAVVYDELLSQRKLTATHNT